MIQRIRAIFTRRRMMILGIVSAISMMLATGVSAVDGTGASAGNALTNLTNVSGFQLMKF